MESCYVDLHLIIHSMSKYYKIIQAAAANQYMHFMMYEMCGPLLILSVTCIYQGL